MGTAVPGGTRDLLCMRQQADDLLQGVIRQLPHLIVSAVLDRVAHEHHGRLETQGFRLGRCGLDELAGGNAYAGNVATFQVCDVMCTTRRAGTSVSQPFNHQVHFTGNLLFQLGGCDTGECGLAVAFDGDFHIRQTLLYAIKEHVAPGL